MRYQHSIILISYKSNSTLRDDLGLLAKVEVAGSTPVSRSLISGT